MVLYDFVRKVLVLLLVVLILTQMLSNEVTNERMNEQTNNWDRLLLLFFSYSATMYVLLPIPLLLTNFDRIEWIFTINNSVMFYALFYFYSIFYFITREGKREREKARERERESYWCLILDKLSYCTPILLLTIDTKVVQQL